MLQTKLDREITENQELKLTIRNHEDEIKRLKDDLEQVQEEKKMAFSEIS